MATSIRWCGILAIAIALSSVGCDPACEATLTPMVCSCNDGRTPSDSCPTAETTCEALCADYGGGTLLVDAGPNPSRGD